MGISKITLSLEYLMAMEKMDTIARDMLEITFNIIYIMICCCEFMFLNPFFLQPIL